MNRQEIFNTSKNHLLTQMKKSYNPADGCLYRYDGLMCAIGPLIPDNIYDPNMEYRGISSLVANFALPEDVFNIGNYSLLQDLQKVHDSFEPELWAVELKKVAKEHDLDA